MKDANPDSQVPEPVILLTKALRLPSMRVGDSTFTGAAMGRMDTPTAISPLCTGDEVPLGQRGTRRPMHNLSRLTPFLFGVLGLWPAYLGYVVGGHRLRGEAGLTYNVCVHGGAIYPLGCFCMGQEFLHPGAWATGG